MTGWLLEIKASSTIMVINLPFGSFIMVSPELDVLMQDAVENLIEFVFAHEERIVLGRDGIFGRKKIEIYFIAGGYDRKPVHGKRRIEV